MSYAEFLDLFFHQERQACTGSGLEKQFIGMTPVLPPRVRLRRRKSSQITLTR
jgi:hypothetical protein